MTGYTDADGSFSVKIIRGPNQVGWQVQLVFDIGAEHNPANRRLLESIQNFFGCSGGIISLEGNQLRYRVVDLKTLLRVRDHFRNYPLESTKLINFQLWSRVLDLVVARQHLTMGGLLLIVAIKSHFPPGLSSMLATTFPLIPLVSKP